MLTSIRFDSRWVCTFVCRWYLYVTYTDSSTNMSLFTEGVTSLCSSCQVALRLPGHQSDGYTPVGKYNFVYTSSHNFDTHDTHDGECDFYVFLLKILRSRDVQDMVKDQTGLEEQVDRMRLPVVMCAEFWFRDNFSSSERETDGLFDECLLIGSLFFPLNPGMLFQPCRSMKGNFESCCVC